MRSFLKKFKVISIPLIWFHSNFVIDIVSYTPTILGDLLRRLYIKIVSKSCGKNFIAHTGV